MINIYVIGFFHLNQIIKNQIIDHLPMNRILKTIYKKIIKQIEKRNSFSNKMINFFQINKEKLI